VLLALLQKRVQNLNFCSSLLCAVDGLRLSINGEAIRHGAHQNVCIIVRDVKSSQVIRTIFDLCGWVIILGLIVENLDYCGI
jgi:hypothetical protein